MTTWITSDLHFGHRAACGYRGFGEEVYHHDETVLESINKLVTYRDTLWVLGDVAWNMDAAPYMGRLNGGTKKLVIGNHDKLNTQVYLKYFNTVHGFLKYKQMWLSHCPVHPQELYRVKANVHGHIHKGAATQPLGFPYFNVNWDFWRRPVELSEIVQWVKENAND